VGVSDSNIEEARRRLLAHIEQRPLFAGTDAATAIMGIMAGLALSLVPILFLGPLGIVFGFGGMIFWASQHSAKDKVRRVEYLRSADTHTVAQRYCETFHPDEDIRLWHYMNNLRDPYRF
jgi:hypothetical protein